jgi:hypothetical protein
MINTARSVRGTGGKVAGVTHIRLKKPMIPQRKSEIRDSRKFDRFSCIDPLAEMYAILAGEQGTGES